jgi:SAM-dependent methyltransferase
MHDDRLTDEGYWDSYWRDLRLPQEIAPGHPGSYQSQILGVFDRYLGNGVGRSALEIGGAPGQYLAYVARTLGYSIACLDYSDVGCEKTRENLRLLGLAGTVYQGDLFADAMDLPSFDVVYSLGLIEHFVDLPGIVGRHLQFLRPGGLLLLGCPNLTGINHLFLRSLAPDLLARHNLETMKASRWREFERRFGLTVLFKGYVGGFEAQVLDRNESGTRHNQILLRIVRVLRRVQNDYPNRLRWLRGNSRLTSAYLMGVYRKPVKT